MHPLKFLLKRIPDRRVRRIVEFVIVFAASLLLGRVVETVLEPDTLDGLKTAQATWLGKVQTFTPLRMVEGYWGDVQAVQRGEYVYVPPPKGVILKQASASTDCLQAQVRVYGAASCNSLARANGVEPFDCIVTADKKGCAEFNACLASAESAQRLDQLPDECVSSGSGSSVLGSLGNGVSIAPVKGVVVPQAEPPHILLIPLAAVLHAATRLSSGGNGGVVFAIAQLVLGLGAFLVLTAWMRSSHEPGFGNFAANLFLAPVAAVALGSVMALALQWLMMAALIAFGWTTSLAVGAAGASGFAGGCWFCFTELTKKGVEHVVVG